MKKDIFDKQAELNQLWLLMEGQILVMNPDEREKIHKTALMLRDTCSECLQLSLFDSFDLEDILKEKFPDENCGEIMEKATGIIREKIYSFVEGFFSDKKSEDFRDGS
jgi:hypothetical protein